MVAIILNDGSRAMAAQWSMGGFKITSLGAGTAGSSDAARMADVTAGVTGSGTTSKIPKWTGSTSIGNSVLEESGGTGLLINTSIPFVQLQGTGIATVILQGLSGDGELKTQTNHPLKFKTNDVRAGYWDTAQSLLVRTDSGGNIITVLQTSDTDPIADSWTTYASGRDAKEPLALEPRGALAQLLAVPIYRYRRRPLATAEEALGSLPTRYRKEQEEVEDLILARNPDGTVAMEEVKDAAGNVVLEEVQGPSGEKVRIPLLRAVGLQPVKRIVTRQRPLPNAEAYTPEEVEAQRQRLIAQKAAMPKFTAQRIGPFIDDAQVPPEILIRNAHRGDEGLDLAAYIGWLHAAVKELALDVAALKAPPTAPPSP